MTEQNRRIEDKRAAGPLTWGEFQETAAPVVAFEQAFHAATNSGEGYDEAIAAGLRASAASAPTRLADEDITVIWQTMPGGPAGWLKSFGFLQFARAVEEQVLDNNVSPAARASADNPSTAGTDEPNAVSMLSGALNHARDALRFYADKEHFHMHQPDEWDTVSGEPQNFYEDSNNTATVEDGSVAKQALEDVAYVERYANLAAPVAQSTTGAAKAQDLSLLARFAMQEAGEVAQRALAPKQSQTQLRQNFKLIINILRAGLADIDRLAAPAAQATTPTAAEVRDKMLLDSMDAWIERNKKNGHHHFVFAFDTDSSAREQIAADDILQSAQGEKGGDE